jgi:hypothetical protein
MNSIPLAPPTSTFAVEAPDVVPGVDFFQSLTCPSTEVVRMCSVLLDIQFRGANSGAEGEILGDSYKVNRIAMHETLVIPICAREVFEI